MSQMFSGSEIDMQSEIRAGDFLYSRMEYTKYFLLRGQQRNITLFHKEFLEYYKNLPGNKFVHLWQITKSILQMIGSIYLKYV